MGNILPFNHHHTKVVDDLTYLCTNIYRTANSLLAGCFVLINRHQTAELYPYVLQVSFRVTLFQYFRHNGSRTVRSAITWK